MDLQITCKYNNHARKKVVTYSKRRDLKIEFMTAHASKGLQADYVFIINNDSGRYGFPSNITDDKVLDLVMDNKEAYPYAEERRLYYVSLTRAKKFVYLMVDKNCKSVFIQEIEDEIRRARVGDVSA